MLLSPPTLLKSDEAALASAAAWLFRHLWQGDKSPDL